MTQLRAPQIVLVTAVVLAALATALGAAAAPVSWTQAAPATSPPGRSFAAMATDRNGDVVLFGGNGATLALSDTWVWDGTDWSEHTAPGGPPGRGGAAVATAPDGTVVLFGGINATTTHFMSDTWLWNGSSWTEASPATRPPARYGSGLATDANGSVVLFGGQGPGGNLNATWRWDGSNWTQAAPNTSPPARVNTAMASGKNGQVVLFGGLDGSTGLNDTWLWDGSNWSQASPATSPSARVGPAMANDRSDNVVLFGGASTTFTDDTWLWDGSGWSQAAPTTSPSARTNAALSVDRNGRMVLFGGFRPGAGALNDTWLLDTAPPTLTVPAGISVPATGRVGAPVTFEVTATDAIDPEPVVTCTPASGATFPIGDTTVACSASDASGNSASARFVVHVRGAAEQLAELAAAVDGVGPGKSLAATVGVARSFLAHGRTWAAYLTLRVFTLEVRALSGRKLPTAQATVLIDDANRIRAVLGCTT